MKEYTGDTKLPEIEVKNKPKVPVESLSTEGCEVR